jgi:hypothetical protein
MPDADSGIAMKRFTITSREKGKITVGYLGTGSVRAGMMNFTASS